MVGDRSPARDHQPPNAAGIARRVDDPWQGGPVAIDFRTIAETRFERHIDDLWAAADLVDELEVNIAAADLLDTVYALKDYWRKVHGATKFDKYATTAGAGEVLGGLVHLRGEGVRAAAVLSTNRDVYSAMYYSHYGVWCWTTAASTYKIGGDLHTAYMWRLSPTVRSGQR